MIARTALLAALLVSPLALAAPVSADRPTVDGFERVHLAAQRAQALDPAADHAIRHAQPIARRGGSMHWVGAPTGPELAPIWLDLALSAAEPLNYRVARAAIASSHGPVDLLAAAFHAADDADVRGALLGGLRTAPEVAVTELLVPALRDPDADVRQVALSVLVRRSDAADHIDAWRISLSDGSAGVRAQAAFGLGVHGSATHIDLLFPLLHDRSPSVRLKTLRALERLEPAAAQRAAATLRTDPDPQVARAARALQP